MLGTLVNVGTILTGSFIGSFGKIDIKDKYKNALFNALGLDMNAIIDNMYKSLYPVT